MAKRESYAEYLGHLPYPWADTLGSPADLTEAKIETMSHLVEDWKTCGCSALDARIRRDRDGMPHDQTLQVKEMWFRGHIRKLRIAYIYNPSMSEMSDANYERQKALDTFKMLKEREAVLVSEIERKRTWVGKLLARWNFG